MSKVTEDYIIKKIRNRKKVLLVYSRDVSAAHLEEFWLLLPELNGMALAKEIFEDKIEFLSERYKKPSKTSSTSTTPTPYNYHHLIIIPYKKINVEKKTVP